MFTKNKEGYKRFNGIIFLMAANYPPTICFQNIISIMISTQYLSIIKVYHHHMRILIVYF
jgi:hypothetical protein